eukprot:TRINITY_DN181_c0_g1_i2.p3 TRINITY_DN181_c0_g1~~TRINITY_DN181_c0_g1_i2.p3  ORF type:complete len:115 (-),score=37.41 TRINITY_DN181_c0_g1_i2:1084-1428(-)
MEEQRQHADLHQVCAQTADSELDDVNDDEPSIGSGGALTSMVKLCETLQRQLVTATADAEEKQQALHSRLQALQLENEALRNQLALAKQPESAVETDTMCPEQVSTDLATDTTC